LIIISLSNIFSLVGSILFRHLYRLYPSLIISIVLGSSIVYNYTLILLIILWIVVSYFLISSINPISCILTQCPLLLFGFMNRSSLMIVGITTSYNFILSSYFTFYWSLSLLKSWTMSSSCFLFRHSFITIILLKGVFMNSIYNCSSILLSLSIHTSISNTKPYIFYICLLTLFNSIY